MRSTTIGLLLGLAAVGFAACSPVATFPSDRIAIRQEIPAGEPVPTLIAEAVGYSCAEYGPDEDPAINLPAGTGMAMYEKVFERLGDGHPQVNPDEPAFSIVKVRARGTEGEVDLFIPNLDGTHSLATLTFRRDLRKYKHVRTKWWNTGELPPPVNYVMLEQFDQAPVEQPVLAHD